MIVKVGVNANSKLHTISYDDIGTFFQVKLCLLHVKVKYFKIVILDSKSNDHDEFINFTIMRFLFVCEHFF